MLDKFEQDLQNLRDEQFCQAFELQAMADLLIRRETERWVTGFANSIVEKEHISRYAWLSKYVRGKRILDIACGSGKGSFVLAQEGGAQQVVGCDLDRNAIKYASIRNKHSNVTFISEDAQNFSDGNKYDTIVSFETIEHLPDVDTFLKGIVNLLKEDGTFYVSTPISKKSFDSKPDNPYHLQEWGFTEFQSLISRYFSVNEIYLQMRHDNYPLLFRIKKAILNFIEGSKVKSIKEKFLSSENIMLPVKFNISDKDLFKNDYGIVGYQILICKKKL